MYTLLCLKWITSKDLSTWNSAQCHVAGWMGVEFGGEWIHVHPSVYVWLSPFAAHLKLSQHCKSAIPQYKICLKKKKRRRRRREEGRIERIKQHVLPTIQFYLQYTQKGIQGKDQEWGTLCPEKTSRTGPQIVRQFQKEISWIRILASSHT